MANRTNTAMQPVDNKALSVNYTVDGQQINLSMDFVTQYLVRGRADLVTPQETLFFINLCKAQRLNPLNGFDIYLIKYDQNKPAQAVVGKQAYMKRMFEHPDYLFKEDGIVVMRGNEICKKEGTCLYPGEQLVGGWCRVHFIRNGKERTAYKEVSFEEYNQGQANWKSKPGTMINKVAISQCAREAFPKDYEGMYSEEEMVASGAIPATYEEVDVQTGEVVEKLDYVKITQEQRQEMMQAISDTYDVLKGSKDDEFIKAKKNAMYKAIMTELGLKNSTDMTVGELKKAMELVEKFAAENKDLHPDIPQDVQDAEYADVPQEEAQ